MRSIPVDPDHKMNPAKAIAELLETPSETPLSLAQMRLGARVLDRIEALGDAAELLLEEAEFAFVRGRLEATQFTRVDRALLACIDTILGAREVRAASKGA